MSTQTVSVLNAGAARLRPAVCAATSAIVFAALFVVCWIPAALGGDLRFSHMAIELFTAQPVGSVAALGEGVLWSLIFAGVTGGLFAVVYNALSAAVRP